MILLSFNFLGIFQVAANNWKMDARFASLDIPQMVKKIHPNLADKADEISHYSGYYSLNPFLLTQTVLANPSIQVKTLAKHLSHEVSSNNKTVNFSHLGVEQSNLDEIQKLMELFGLNSRIKSASTDNKPVFDLPFNHNSAWVFNGVHTWTGENNGDPMSSIDFTLSWGENWGTNTNSNWVAAASDGIVSVFSSCFVRVTHPSGWATDYYHLDNIQFNHGEEVRAGQLIANYASNMDQALCDGGSSTGPHLHFAIVQNGERAVLNGTELSKWLVHSGWNSYDGDHARMWLERDAEKKFVFFSRVDHKSGDNIIDYRYSGIYSSNEINGHGVNITVSQIPIDNSEKTRNILFVAFYTYDDNGNANFFVGNTDFDGWRVDEAKSVNIIQTSGGDFTNLNPVNFETDVTNAGIMSLHFLNCSQVELDFSIIEPNTGEEVSHDLLLSKSVGIPDHVCQAPSLLLH